MSDQRLCMICNPLVDIEHPDVVVIQGGGGSRRITVRDNTTGLVHLVTTKKLTEKRLAGATAPSPYGENDEPAQTR